MIIDGPLSPERRQRSQKYYNLFSLLNGFSYMCLGDTVIILLALNLNCPDYVVSTLGAMLYASYLVLPIGKVVAARVGAVRCQSIFWILRNCAALIVAASVPVTHLGYPDLAISLLLGGAFLFYGFRAAGTVMIQPLIGDITSEAERPLFIGSNAMFFNIACFLALLGIIALLHIHEDGWTLMGVVVVGSAFGLTSTHFIRKIDETSAPRESARRPVWGELRLCLANPVFIPQMLSGFVVNMAVIMTVPTTMLALKRGYGVSDRNALFFSLIHLTSAVIMSQLAGKVSARIGPRKVLLYCYCAFLLTALLWAVSPLQLLPVFIWMPFFLVGGAYVSSNNATTHYFLQTIPENNRVVASIAINVIPGALAGFVGMLLSGALLNWVNGQFADVAAIHRYRAYFTISGIILLPGIFCIKRLPPLPIEKRRLKVRWQDLF
ncbi:MAG: MFS transporter [Lentisphaerae bacterium]|nr:MFS transporter [Lentisphaerota bacterium]